MNAPRSRAGVVVTAVAVAATLLAGCSASPAESGGDALTPLNINIGTPYPNQAGQFIADTNGYYADAGIDVNFITGGPNALAPEVSLATGESDIAFETDSFRMFSYLAENDDVVIIGQLGRGSMNGIISLAADPIETPDDLAGSAIMASPSSAALVDAIMSINGVTDYTFVPGGFEVEPLLAGQGGASGMTGSELNQVIALESQGLVLGEDFFYAPFDELNYFDMPTTMLASRSFVEEHPEIIESFFEVTAQGWTEALADIPAAVDLTLSDYAADLGLDPERMYLFLEALAPFMQPVEDGDFGPGVLTIDPDFVESDVFPSLQAAGLTAVPELSDVLDLGPLENVVG